MEENNGNKKDERKKLVLPINVLIYGIIVFIFIVALMIFVRVEKTKAILEVNSVKSINKECCIDDYFEIL